MIMINLIIVKNRIPEVLQRNESLKFNDLTKAKSLYFG